MQIMCYRHYCNLIKKLIKTEEGENKGINFQKSLKTLLLLSCASILGSLVNTPMVVTTEEAENTDMHTEEITEVIE